MSELTPVERGTLFVLMAVGQPLRESADLKETYGLTLNATHRTKLQRLGLITTTVKPFTHALSQAGWQWAEDQLSASQPKGLMGMAPLYALLHGLRKHIEEHHYSLRDIFSKVGGGADTAERDIENVAWAEADEALAQALQDMSVFDRAMNKLQETATEEHISKLVKRMALASNLILQSVRQAARKRDLSFAIQEGEGTTFDPVKHRSDEELKTGCAVKIRKSPVVRGPANLGLVVLKGEVDPV